MVDAAVGHGVLAVAVDRLDAVAVGVEQEPAVVRRAVLRARPRRAVVAVPRVDPGLPERVDLRAVAGAEADVEPTGHRLLTVRRSDVPVVPLDQLCVRMAGLDGQDAQDGAVEALGGREVRDGDANVVEHQVEATVARLECEPTGLLRPDGGAVTGVGVRRRGCLTVQTFKTIGPRADLWDCVGSMPSVLGHCILGSCVGSGYLGGQP